MSRASKDEDSHTTFAVEGHSSSLEMDRDKRNISGSAARASGLEVALLTGGQDRPYAVGLAMALVAKDITLDLIGSDIVDSPEMHTTPRLRFLNLRSNQRRCAGPYEKVLKVLLYYARLFRYAAVAKPKIFHILWNNRFEYFDRTLLMLYYRLCGRVVVLTAHNINAARRDSRDSFLNRLTLRIQYRLTSHIFVHTSKMKNELVDEFGVSASAITVLAHPINDAFPDTELTTAEAKQRMGIQSSDRTILFFGRLQPYKGLEYLISALEHMAAKHKNYRLIIAGEPKKGSETYEAEIRRRIAPGVNAGMILPVLKFIPDHDVEVYFKAADVLVLPYKEIFQSGVLFLGLTFGLPVVASDVGSFAQDVVEGKAGMLCRPGDPVDLARALEAYFETDLFRDLSNWRQKIREATLAQHSWKAVADLTCTVYANVAAR